MYKIDIAYIDPPYKTNLAYESIKTILDKKIISKDSIMIIETDEKERVINQIKDLKLEIIDQRKYGRAYLIFLREK